MIGLGSGMAGERDFSNTLSKLRQSLSRGWMFVCSKSYLFHCQAVIAITACCTETVPTFFLSDLLFSLPVFQYVLSVGVVLLWTLVGGPLDDLSVLRNLSLRGVVCRGIDISAFARGVDD